MALRTGKLPLDLLEELLHLRGSDDTSVRLGPAIGEDAAVIDFGDKYLILKTDPVTFAVDEIGWYAVNINANDVATTGAKPRWFQVTLLLPEGSQEKEVRSVLRQVHDACVELGIALTGGHTEVTPTVNQTVLVGDMHGVVGRDNLILTSGARSDDTLIMTKTAGIEGTAILARERARELRGHVDDAVLARASEFLRKPGISVVSEALLAAHSGATSIHDPTEGGVAMGLYEISAACGRVLEVDPSAIPIEEETRALCDFYGLNPLGLIGSGCLLVAVPASKTDELLESYRRAGVRVTVVGEVADKGVGIRQVGKPAPYPLIPSETDEITKVLRS